MKNSQITLGAVLLLLAAGAVYVFGTQPADVQPSAEAASTEATAPAAPAATEPVATEPVATEPAAPEAACTQYSMQAGVWVCTAGGN